MAPPSTKNTLGFLPVEIIIEILARSPIKTLRRFQSVCKSWYSLIKSPHFIKLHHNRSLKSNSDRYIFHSSYPLLGLAELGDQITFLRNVPMLKARNYDYLKVFGACHGIVCIYDSCRNLIVLYNPFTNTHHSISFPFVFDSQPVLCEQRFGFGYDSSGDDYKVVSMIFATKTCNIGMSHVYSLKNRSWKCVESLPPLGAVKQNDVVLVNEALHCHVENIKTKFVVSFDLHSETFSILDFPKDGGDVCCWPILGNLNGDLSVTLNRNGHNECWIMKEYGKKESWTMLFKIRHKPSPVEFMAFSNDGSKVLFKDNKDYLFWFDMKDNKVKKTNKGKDGDGGKQLLHDSADILIGSLISLGEERSSQYGGGG